MAPHKSTRSTLVNNNNIVSFSSKKIEGQNVETIICTPKYITVEELKKPAVVTDRLRRDYLDLKCYDRISMKAGVRKILGLSEVIQAVNAYCSAEFNDLNAASNNNDDDSLVSTN